MDMRSPPSTFNPKSTCGYKENHSDQFPTPMVGISNPFLVTLLPFPSVKLQLYRNKEKSVEEASELHAL